MRKSIIVVVGLVALMFTTVPADHNWPGRHDRGHPGWQPGPGRCSAPCQGQRHGEGMRPGMRGGTPGIKMLLKMGDEIDLTDSQREQLEQMVVRFGTERVDTEAAVEKAQIRLRALLMDEDAIESEVMAAIDRVAQEKAQLQKMRYRHHQQVSDLLTQQQRDKLRELHQTRMQNRERPGRRSNPRGGGGLGFWPDDRAPDDDG